MSSFVCPFCGCMVPFDHVTHDVVTFPSKNSYLNAHYEDHSGTLHTYLCTNCGRIHVKAEKQGKLDAFDALVYPQAIYRSFPDYIPEQIRQDYEEACKIRALSPKASATLCRRCLQGMIRDFWAVTPDMLYNEIAALQGRLPVEQWKAIDALRQLGNIGAHMERDVNLIIDIDPHEADLLITLIEHLMVSWYISRHAEQAMYEQIIQANAVKQSGRHTPH